MPLETFEYKAASLGSTAAANGSLNLDEAQGIVECFVAGIGNRDSVGDICASGAFTKSLMRRKPRVVWGHNWNDPIGKVLEIYEVPATDNRLPMKMKMAGIGGLFARVQFNLFSEKGKEAFSNVAFFGQEQEWSIGYKTLRAQYDQKSQANVIYELELYEVSPVLHGANQLTGTISVKSDGQSAVMENPQMATPVPDAYNEIDIQDLEKQLSLMVGKKISVTGVADNHVMYGHVGENGQNEKYKCPFMHNNGRFMFGAPMAMPAPIRLPVPSNMPTPQSQAPSVPIRPPAASVPVAFKPTGDGIAVIALPRVEYATPSSDQQTPGNLDKEEADLRDALLKIVSRHGKFNEDSEGVWAGYTPAIENEIARIGVKCSNCVFFQGEGKCKIIDMAVEGEGKCRFAVIPPGVVNAGPSAMKSYRLDELNSEVEYLTDIEVKYPEDLAVVSLRGAIENKFLSRRKYKSLAEFGLGDYYDDKPYYVPVVPEHAFNVKQALDPIFDYHRVESFVDVEGIVLTSGVTLELIDAVDTALNNLKKKSLIEFDFETKAAGYRLGRAVGSRLIDRPTLGDRHLGDNRRNRSMDVDIPTAGVRGYRKPTFSTFDPDNDGWVDEGSTHPRFIGIQNALKPLGAPDAKPKDRIPSAKKPVEKLENTVVDSVDKISAPESIKPDKKINILSKGISKDYKSYLNMDPKKRSDEDIFKYDGPLAKLSSGQDIDDTSLQEMYDLMAKDFLASLEKVNNNPNSEWEFPWRRAMFFATNPTTERTYEGTNQFLLMQVASNRGYELPRWAGVVQWKKAGGKFEPGYESKIVQITAPNKGRPGFHTAEVINVAEVKGLPEEFYKPISHDALDEAKRMKDIEDVISEIGPNWKEAKQGRAFFSVQGDSITMPPFSSFKDPIGFYSTLLHETTHWTGHPSRLNRDQTGRRKGAGAESKSRYAYEELIAEIGSAFAMGILGLEPTIREDHAQYVSGWMSAIRKNPNALKDALEQAQMAVDYMMNKSPTLRRVAGKRDDERKGRQDISFTVPGANGARRVTVQIGPPKKGEIRPAGPQAPFRVPTGYGKKKVAISSGLNNIERLTPIKDADGNSYDASYRKLSSGANLPPIVSTKDPSRSIKRTSAEEYQEKFGIKFTPTDEQAAIWDVMQHFIEQPGGLVAVRAGAGTGKTTSLENGAQILAQLAAENPEKFAGVSMYYVTFARKNAAEARGKLPENNTGVGTLNQIAYWSLRNGSGKEMFGEKTSIKVQYGSMRPDTFWWPDKHTNSKARKAKFKTATHFDGSQVDITGSKTVGFNILGYVAFDKEGGGVDVVEKYKLDEKYPNGIDFEGVNITAREYGDILNNALTRFAISADDVPTKEHFIPRGEQQQSRARRVSKGKTVSPIDTLWEGPVPEEWLDQVKQMWTDITDENSNVVPTYDHQVKMWALTKPDLRTDPGLVGHGSRQEKAAKKGDALGSKVFGGNTGIVEEGINGKKMWRRTYASETHPLSVFLFDEAQDVNPVVQQIIDANVSRKENPASVVMVGDPRQAIFGFRGSTDTFQNVDADFNLTLRDSFRYGPTTEYLANITLQIGNIEDRAKGLDEINTSAQVFGRAHGVVEADFNIDDLSGTGLEEKLTKLDTKYGVFYNDYQRRQGVEVEDYQSLSPQVLMKLSEDERNDVLRKATEALASEAEGSIVVNYQWDRPGTNLLITRGNTGLIDAAVHVPVWKSVGIPEDRHAKILSFMKHMAWIQTPPAKRSKQKPRQSNIVGNAWDMGEIQKRSSMVSNQELSSLMNLFSIQKPADDQGKVYNYSAQDYVRMLEGQYDATTKSIVEGSVKIHPVAEQLELDPWVALSGFDLQGRSKASGKGKGGGGLHGDAKIGPDTRWTFIENPSTSQSERREVWMKLNTNTDGQIGLVKPGTKPGEWDGSVVLSGDGVMGTHQYGATATQAAQLTQRGASRDHIEEIVKQRDWGDKVTFHEKSYNRKPTSTPDPNARPPFDAWVIRGDNDEETAEIANEIAKSLIARVNEKNVDIETTTAHGAKGLEADNVMLWNDFSSMADSLVFGDDGKIVSMDRQEANLLYVALSRSKRVIDVGPSLSWLFDETINPGHQGVVDSLAPEQQKPSGYFNPYTEKPKVPTFKSVLKGVVVDTKKTKKKNTPKYTSQDEPSYDAVKLSSGAPSSNAGGRLSRRIRTVGNAGEDMSGAEGDTRRLAHPIELAGFSSVTKNSGTNRAITKTSMNIWKGFRDNGIALDIDSDSTDPSQKQKVLSEALGAISERMRERPSIKIGNISQNGGNEQPSAATWMLSVSKLKDSIRIPTEYTKDYTDTGSLSESFHSQTRPITNTELASMLGLGRRDAALLDKDGAAINHDAVRYMLAETGKQQEFGAWRLFAPVSADEAKDKKWNAEEVFAENIGRASMRDRFIVEAFGKDAFPHWFDQEEQQSITPDEYASLGEVSPVAKFQAMGRFQKNSATDGDSEAEHELMLQGMSGVSLTPSGTVTAAEIATDKTSRQDFKIGPLLEHLGISKNDNWHDKLRQVIAESFSTENVGLGSKRDAAEWEKKGVPVAYIDEMIRKGVIPDASSIWTEGKAGEQLDSELSRSKHAVYEALNEFIQKSGVDKTKANRDTVHSIIGKKDIHTELPKLAATRGPVFSPKKGDSPRYSMMELQGVVNRFNKIFGTEYSIDDIFSAEQLRTARERIEKDGQTLYGKNKNGTRVVSDSTAV